MNSVNLIGNMTKDPKVKSLESGTVASFTIAVPRTSGSKRNPSHRAGDRADFIKIKCWNRLAENVSKYCHKGSMISVEGELQSRIYSDDSGISRTAIEVNARRIQFLSPKKKDAPTYPRKNGSRLEDRSSSSDQSSIFLSHSKTDDGSEKEDSDSAAGQVDDTPSPVKEEDDTFIVRMEDMYMDSFDLSDIEL